MSRPTACPIPERLQALLDGIASDFEADALTAHLDACTECRQKLETLASGAESPGSLASKLRLEAGEVTPALAAVLDGLRPGTTATTDSAEAAREERSTPGALPRRVGPYRVEGLIGVGGMGRVMKAFDPNLRRVVALKVMADPLAANATARSRFKREARAAASITHDHVITIHGVDEEGGIPYIVMQYVQGKSLQERIDESGALGLREVLRIGNQIAEGLAAAHGQGIVHRDVKPSNILLENGIERVKLTDFGLARVNDDLGETVTGVIAGTPQYMSPEQAKGEALDHRSDLFSLGAVLYAMCTGEPPFRGGHPLSILKRVCEEEPRSPRLVNPELPEWLAAIIGKLMAKDPAQRFQSAEEIAHLLAGHLAHLQQPTTAAMPGPVRHNHPVPATSSHPPMWQRQLVALLGVLVLTAFLASSIWRKELDDEWPAALIGAGVLGLLIWRWSGRSPHATRGGDAGATWSPPHWLFVAALAAVGGGAVMLAVDKRFMRDVFFVTWPLLAVAGIAAVTMVLAWAFHRHRGPHGRRAGLFGWGALGVFLAAGLFALGVVREYREEIFWQGPPGQGAIYISVSDPQVRVVLEGGAVGKLEFDGRSPLTDYLPAGQYMVSAFKDGELLQQQPVQITARRRWYVSIPTVGSVRFLPTDAEVKVDGKSLSWDVLQRLPVGRHKWEAQKDGKVINRGEFFLRGEESLVIPVTPPPGRQAEIDKLRAAVASNEKLLTFARARFEEGMIPRSEFLAAEIALAESRSELAKAEGKTEERIGHLREIVAKRERQLDDVKARIKAGQERLEAHIDLDRRLQEARLELSAAESEMPKKKP